jgi:hypothetical protein
MRARLSAYHLRGILVTKQLWTMCESAAIAASASGARSEVAAILVIIPHHATKIDLKADFTEVKTATGGRDHTAIIKWAVPWVLATAAWMFAVAKFAH